MHDNEMIKYVQGPYTFRKNWINQFGFDERCLAK